MRYTTSSRENQGINKPASPRNQGTNKPVVSLVCYEPEGEFLRHVYPMDFTIENLHVLWEKSREFPTLFSTEVRNDFSKFCNIFLSVGSDGNLKANGLAYVVDDFVGVYYLTDIYPNLDAQTHYTFFDRRHRGRIMLTKALIQYVMKEYNFQRLSTIVPSFVDSRVRRFVMNIGFTLEGEKRNSIWYKGNLYNEYLYGIVRTDVLKETNNGTEQS